MPHNNTEVSELSLINELDFITNEFLSEVKGDEPVSSSMLDKIFVPSARVPKAITDKLTNSSKSAEQIALQEIPLYQTTISKPYWNGQRLIVEIFGAICLADDRHLLDVIIAHGTMINQASKYTLRQVAEEGLGIQDVDWDAYKNQARIDLPMNNTGTYFHVSVKEVCRGLGIKLQKSARETIKNRLRRLRNMELKITPEHNGEPIHHKMNELHIVGQDYHLLLDKSQMKGTDYDKQTYTELIINIDNFYVRSLEDDGIISRKRLQNHYIHLVGRNNIEDFFKHIDSHQRRWVHGKYLSEMISGYFDNKMSTFGINRNYKLRQIFNQVIDVKEKLIKHFGIKLHKIERKNCIDKEYDYVLYHLPTAEELKK